MSAQHTPFFGSFPTSTVRRDGSSFKQLSKITSGVKDHVEKPVKKTVNPMSRLLPVTEDYSNNILSAVMLMKDEILCLFPLNQSRSVIPHL